LRVHVGGRDRNRFFDPVVDHEFVWFIVFGVGGGGGGSVFDFSVKEEESRFVVE
jgi:hypothetical protein